MKTEINTNPTPQQLRLAADIIETEHPFEVLVGPWCKPIPTEDDPLVCIAIGMHIRLTLATPPDGRPLHNPDNLTAEQVGAGWRLLVVGEKQPKGYEYWTTKKWLSGNAIGETVDECNKDTTCRVPLSTPWPEASKPDPYAEPSTKTVELGPEDVPPGSVFSFPDWQQPTSYVATLQVHDTHVLLHTTIPQWYSFKQLCEFKINRSIPLTGKWNPDAWEPCHKTIPSSVTPADQPV